MALVRGYDADEDEVEDQKIKPLTAQEAKVLRERDPAVSPWWVLGLQCLVGIVAVLFAWGISGKASVAWSVAYGVLAVVLPAALFARGVMSRFSSLNATTAHLGFFLWEAVKMIVSVVMIILAPRLVVDLNWLALLAGLFVTLKMYWVALLKRPQSKPN